MALWLYGQLTSFFIFAFLVMSPVTVEGEKTFFSLHASDRLVNHRLTQKFWCAYVGSRIVNVDES
jgi:hypothetical protein